MNRRSRISRAALGATAIAALALSVAACGSSGSSASSAGGAAAGTPKQGGNLTFFIQQFPTGWVSSESNISSYWASRTCSSPTTCR